MKHTLTLLIALAMLWPCTALATTPPLPVKGSDLPAASTLGGTEYLLGIQGGTVKISATQLATWLQSDLGPVFAPLTHSHSINEVTGLQTALNGKLDTGASIAWSQLTGAPSFATVATTGSYTDLTSKPTLGTAAAQDTTAFDASGAASAVSSALTTALAGKVPATITVNGHALSSNVIVSKSDVGLGSAENTALSTWAGSTNVTTLGTISSGTWHGTAIADSYIASAATWNAKQSPATTLSGYGITDGVASTITVNGHALSSNVTVSKSDVGLGSAENTALSTWTGSTNVTTLGTISSGIWHGTAIADSYLASAATWNAKQSPATTLSGYGITDGVASTITVNGHALNGNVTVSKSDLGLGNAENTALSTWAGSSGVTTLGTIATGIWHGTAIGDGYIASAATWNAKQSPATTLSGYGITDGVASTITVNGHALNGNVTVSKADLGLGNAENIALSTWAGSSGVTTLGTIATGIWHGTAIGDSYLASAAAWNAKQAPATTLSGYGITDGVSASRTVNGHALSGNVSVLASDLGLGAVENTALSTWGGTTNLVTLGTVSSGTWHGTAITDGYLASASTWNAKQNALTAGTDYLSPTGTGSGLTSLNATSISSGTLNAARLPDLSATYQPLSTATTTELGYVHGVTGALQTQLAGKVATSTTVNGHALSGNVTVSASDLSLGSVSNTSDATKNSATATLTNKTIDAASNTVTVYEGNLSTSDITTANASTSKHGLLRKLDNNSAHYLDGTGNWSTPAGGGSAATDPHLAHVQSDGNDSTGDGSPGKPYATIQAAANAGFANFALGVGNFGDLDMNSTPTICLSGAGWGASTIGNITTNLSNLTIVDVGGSVWVYGNITTGSAQAADSGSLDLYDVRCSGYIITSGTGGVGGTAGPGSGSSGYNAGNITLHGNCSAPQLYLDGGNGGSAGSTSVARWAQSQFNFNPGSTYNLVVTTTLATRTFTFAPSDPGAGGIYLGDASGVPGSDFGAVASAVSAEASALGVTYTFDGTTFEIILTANTVGGGFALSASGSDVPFNTYTAGADYPYAGSGGLAGNLTIYGPSVIPRSSLLGGTAGTGLDNHGGGVSTAPNGIVNADGADLRGGGMSAGAVTLGRCSYITGTLGYSSFVDKGGNASY